MRRRGQGALEYLFMLALALVVIAVIIRKFLAPRSGTINHVGSFSSNVEENITSNLNSMLSS